MSVIEAGNFWLACNWEEPYIPDYVDVDAAARMYTRPIYWLTGTKLLDRFRQSA